MLKNGASQLGLFLIIFSLMAPLYGAGATGALPAGAVHLTPARLGSSAQFADDVEMTELTLAAGACEADEEGLMVETCGVAALSLGSGYEADAEHAPSPVVEKVRRAPFGLEVLLAVGHLKPLEKATMRFVGFRVAPETLTEEAVYAFLEETFTSLKEFWTLERRTELLGLCSSKGFDMVKLLARLELSLEYMAHKDSE